MNTEKNMSTRIIHKHDIEANWNKATNFIPRQGELIVYDPDENCSYQRIKIGDGTTKINDLNFTKASGYVAQPEAPYDTSLFWLDTDDDTIDEDGSSSSGTSAPSDWNAAEGQPGHVLNRTHWVETVTVDPTFDGDMTGKESVQIDADPVAYAVKVSSDVVSVVELIGATIDVKSTSGDYTISVTSEIAMDAQNVFGVSGAVVLQGGVPAVISLTEDCEIQGFSLTSGTWFMCVPGVLYIASLSCLKSGEVEIVHKLPEKFLPEGYPYTEKITINPTFDGDLTGKEKILADASIGAYAVKITPQIVAVDELIGSTMVLNMGGEEQTVTLTTETAMDSTSILGVSGAVVLQGTDPVVLSLAQDSTIQGATFSAGTWFMCIPGAFYVKSVSCEAEKIHKLDNKFIDAEWMAKSEIINIDPTINGFSSIGNRETIKLSNSGEIFIKVTDQYVTTSEIINSTACYVVNGIRKTGTVTTDSLIDLTDTFGALGTGIPCGSQIILTVPDSTMIDVLGITLTKGTWFSYTSDENYVESLSCLFAGPKEVAHVIPKKFLPDMLPEVDSSNEGAFLRVINGSWAVDMLANVEDGEF